MMDNVFLDAVYWLFMNKDFISISSSLFIFISIGLALLLLIKNWGDAY